MSRAPSATAADRAMPMAKTGGMALAISAPRGACAVAVKVRDRICGSAAAPRIGALILIAIAALAVGPVATARAAPPAASGTDADLRAWAMRWFAEIQAGRTDRTQYAPAFAPEVTDGAVKMMSLDLNRYGASPLRAEITQTRKIGEQTFYIVKFIFPRGDATTLLFGFDAAGKITGVRPQSFAGD
jgi:hypothetical protein